MALGVYGQWRREGAAPACDHLLAGAIEVAVGHNGWAMAGWEVMVEEEEEEEEED